MKKILFLFCLSLILLSCKDSKKSTKLETTKNSKTQKTTNKHIDDVKKFQYEMNTKFADTSTSPLTKEDVTTFKSLDFFEIDENYRVEATLELTPNAPVFEMQTTTARLPLYKKYGIAHFTLNGIKCELSLYQNQQYLTSAEYGHLLFMPFNDSTNDNTTYGGGRFIDIETPKTGDNTIVIDFNMSYNPYCAYNHKYSCPIPPSENTLNVAISAGEKAYKKAH